MKIWVGIDPSMRMTGIAVVRESPREILRAFTVPSSLMDPIEIGKDIAASLICEVLHVYEVIDGMGIETPFLGMHNNVATMRNHVMLIASLLTSLDLREDFLWSKMIIRVDNKQAKKALGLVHGRNKIPKSDVIERILQIYPAQKEMISACKKPVQEAICDAIAVAEAVAAHCRIRPEPGVEAGAEKGLPHSPAGHRSSRLGLVRDQRRGTSLRRR